MKMLKFLDMFQVSVWERSDLHFFISKRFFKNVVISWSARVALAKNEVGTAGTGPSGTETILWSCAALRAQVWGMDLC